MTFFNSYKMKVSIVFGVAQMTLGLCCSLVNHIYYKDRRSIWFGFVPEICFFLSIFGYLVFMIFAKWATDWVGEAKRPPSLLNTLIAMFMSPGSYKEEDRIFAGQEHVQLLLLLIAFISVPLLLLPKPILAYLDMKKKAAQPLPRSELDAVAEGSPAAGPSGEAEGEEQEGDGLADVVVHQVIHTIEFVLGSISNTASYLRLWALSLAHSQLSELFWDKVMVAQAFGSKLPAPLHAAVVFFAFAVWFILNLGVLMVMENLSSFLHALRLQWVEFQNKFYHGDGVMYKPFAYAKLGAARDE